MGQIVFLVKTKMDKKSKIFFLILFLFILGSVAVTYWRVMIKRDYIISAQQECDPKIEACFVSKCNPEEDEECTATPEEERVSYYKSINKNAKNIPLCDPYKNECPEELACEEGEEECEEILCDEENVPEGEECNDPAVYNEENPSEKEGCECNGVGDETAMDDNSENIKRDPNCVCDSFDEETDETLDEKPVQY